jgi:Lipase (class 3)
MNIPVAISAGLLVQFLYDVWSKTPGATNLDGREVAITNGQPVIPSKTYRVLKTIYSNDLATDIHPKKPIDSDDYTMIGMVAQNKADDTDIVIAVRGTEGVWEWIQDVKFIPRPFPNVPGSGLTEDGFTDMYLSFSLTPSASAATFIQDVADLIPAPDKAKVTVVGHSLGSSLATLLALDLAANTKLDTTLYTFASPRVGDLSFHNLFNHVVPSAYRIANRIDVVTQTPPALLYFHVGDDTELVPPDTMKFDIKCEHHITTYFNMLAAKIGLQAAFPINAECLKAAPPA